ncbi:MAG: STAS domain-containing protein [Burkholderiales bacterium]|nr:STAS domain-containing protein [Burkholderiales bacterium]
MADQKNVPGFLAKVARFVANPTTDWSDLASVGPDAAESEYAKSEIKAMIERKRRNDFVRKRELDMLRKIRREGLSGQPEALLPTSNLDSEGRHQDNARPQLAVKDKIDAIEQQMVGESLRRHAVQQERSASFFNATTLPAAMGEEPLARPAEADNNISPAVIEAARAAGQPQTAPDMSWQHAATAPLTLPPTSPLSPLAGGTPSDFVNAMAVDVSEVVHDPELDEAVIAFANADFDQCERSLMGLIADGASRADHPDTWLVLFDLYRATDQQDKFEQLAVTFAQRFGQSAPQWFSLPRQVAAAAEQARAAAPAPAQAAAGSPAPAGAVAGWVSPVRLDVEAVARLRSQLLQTPRPWHLDWTDLGSIETQACAELSQLLRAWAREPMEMRWAGVDQLQGVLRDATPTGVRDVDPAYWLLRLDVMRLVNRADQFDEVAIDYCVTYEVSPPSWEPTACKVETHDEGSSTTAAPLSRISDVSTSFVESRLMDEPAQLQVATLELSGQLVGDIGSTLKGLDEALGAANVVEIACTRLIRVDFIAAGDLLNWVLARRGEQRLIQFEQANRLVALFFGAMGINEHARVRLRNV